MERVGVSRRLPAAILDGLFILILAGIGATIYATVGGARLALQAQKALGIPMTWNNLVSEDLWRQYGRRFEEMTGDIERMIQEDFTDEQTEFIGRTLSDSLEDHFAPDRLSVQFLLDLDEDDLNELVDEAFDSVIAAERADISAAKVNLLRDEVKKTMDEFGVGTIVPKVIGFAIGLAFLQAVIILLYGLGEAVFGRSLGKRALGIAISRDDGERAHAGNYMLRYALKNSPVLLLVLALLLRSPGVAAAAGVSVVVIALGLLVMLGPERRAIYDYIGGTAVVRIGPGEDS
ncbi:MAG: RDD family protein [Spirochaetia bacterium]